MKLYFDESPKIKYKFETRRTSKSFLSSLRQKERLDLIVKNCEGEYEVAKALCIWASKRISHGQSEARNPDAISILKDADSGMKLRCVEYSILLKESLQCLGISSRTLALKVKNIETIEVSGGHVVVEAYLKEYNKWTMFDPQFAAFATLRGQPLNAVELQSTLTRKDRNLKIKAKVPRAGYIRFLYKYLIYFDTRLSARKILMLVPLGFKNPKIFQRVYPMKNYVYTHSLKTFYQKP